MVRASRKTARIRSFGVFFFYGPDGFDAAGRCQVADAHGGAGFFGQGESPVGGGLAAGGERSSVVEDEQQEVLRRWPGRG